MGSRQSVQQFPGPAAFASPEQPVQHRVRLCITPMNLPFVPNIGMAPPAYHTSVLVDEVEYCFGGLGIVTGRPCMSHASFQEKTEVIDLGLSPMSGEEMKQVLTMFFLPGSYDLLRKNCNNFSKCAIYCLLGMPMDRKYQAMESVAAQATALVQLLTFGGYTPNPDADGFMDENVVEILRASRQNPSGSVIPTSLPMILGGSNVGTFADKVPQGLPPSGWRTQAPGLFTLFRESAHESLAHESLAPSGATRAPLRAF
eukprot:TRINITY_DN23770_c0_g1_i1.p1 TRINITY_DN23770_c0_g1~~TRINITY_DN23770_c0_g1_i1.p1  ORF type:complete len:257 (+),score=52.06 TRINITY_DN23770_c0_g1_i1:104-874(+)